MTASKKGQCPQCGRKNVVLLAHTGDEVCRQCVSRRNAGAATWTLCLTTLTPAGKVGPRQWRSGMQWVEATTLMAETLQAGKTAEAWIFRDDVEWKKGTRCR